jgi:O-antigen ligase
VTLGALFLVPFLAIYVDPALYFPFVAGRGFAFRLIVEAAVAGWLVMAAADRRYRPSGSWTAAFFGLLVLWMALADALAVNPHKAFWGTYERMEGWVTLAHLFVLFVVAGCVLGAEDLWRRWWLTFAAASALVCGYGLLQIARLAPISVPPRIDANFGNPEFLAGYLLFAIPTTLWLALDMSGPKRRVWRGALLALAALQTAILAASGTRGAYAGLVAGLAFAVILWPRRAKTARRAIAVVGVAAIVALASLLVWIGLHPALAHHPLAARGPDALRARFTLWEMAWNGFLAQPITGWGHEGFLYVFYRFFSPSLASYAPWFDRAHNLYLDWLVIGGLPALLLFLGLMASGAYALARGSFSPGGRILLLSALVAYAVQGLVVFDNLFTYVPLVALLGLAHSQRARPIPRRVEAPELAPRGAKIAAPLALAGLALVVGFVTVPGLRANRYLNRVLNPPTGSPAPFGSFKRALDARGFASAEICEKLVQAAALVAGSDASETDKAAFVTYAIDQMRIELDRAPHEPRLRLALARLYRRLGDMDEALAQTKLALRDDPHDPLLLGERALELGQPARLQPARADAAPW